MNEKDVRSKVKGMAKEHKRIAKEEKEAEKLKLAALRKVDLAQWEADVIVWKETLATCIYGRKATVESR